MTSARQPELIETPRFQTQILQLEGNIRVIDKNVADCETKIAEYEAVVANNQAYIASRRKEIAAALEKREVYEEAVLVLKQASELRSAYSQWLTPEPPYYDV